MTQSLPGLFFERPDLENLPPVALPEGCVLRSYQPGDELSASVCLNAAYDNDWPPDRVIRDLAANDFVKKMLVIVKDGRVVATASAASNQEFGDKGYVHFVATHPDYRGMALGYWVTLAVLHVFREMGMKGSVLHTDDFRIPAIKTYLKLGYSLRMGDHASYPERWAAILEKLG